MLCHSPLHPVNRTGEHVAHLFPACNHLLLRQLFFAHPSHTSHPRPALRPSAFFCLSAPPHVTHATAASHSSSLRSQSGTSHRSGHDSDQRKHCHENALTGRPVLHFGVA